MSEYNTFGGRGVEGKKKIINKEGKKENFHAFQHTETSILIFKKVIASFPVHVTTYKSEH